MARGKTREQRRQAVGLSWLFGAEQLTVEDMQRYIDSGTCGEDDGTPVPALTNNPQAMEALERRYQEMRGNGWNI